jgi:UDPglucose 6-dehydrogenase
MKICVQGLWHLGSVSAAALASMGHQVLGLDGDVAVVEGLKQGRPPIFEPGLESLVREGINAGRLRFESDPAAIPADLELLWVAYDTPVDDDDVADVDFVIAQIARVLPHLPDDTTVLLSSQMPVGSARRLEALAASACPGKQLSFAVSPENLRLGKALDVFLKPDRVVVGTRSERDRQRIAAALEPIDARIEWMSVESAEMTKHAINAFLATSVVFANEIACLCERTGADAKEVERGLKSEQRIGPKAYLSPGAAFAGGTLARDLEFLKTIGRDSSLPIPMLESVRASNDQHKTWARRRLASLVPTLQDLHVTLWGLTYKPGTDTLRRSLAVELGDWLLANGARLTVHDPAVKDLPPSWQGRVKRSADATEALVGAHALIVGTEWPLYREISAQRVAEVAPGLLVLDANRFLGSLAHTATLRYVAVGTPTTQAQA